MADRLFGTGVNAPSIQQVRVTPAGVPGSTFVRPQSVETGGNLRALADALGGLNSALQNYGNVAARDAKDPDSEPNRAFLDSIQGKSPDELRALAAQGGFNRIQADGLNTLLGSKMAYEFRQHLTEAYNTEFDQSAGDFASWSEQQRQEWAGRLPDQASQAAFFRATEQWTQQFGAKDLERKLTTAIGERDTAVIDEFRMIGEDAAAEGRKPVEIAEAIVRQSRLNREFRGMDGAAQNATLFQLATEYAARGEVEIVKAILDHDRGGVGALGKTAQYSVKALGLIEDAETKAAAVSNEESFNLRVYVDGKIGDGTFTQAEARALKEKHPWITDAQAASWVDQSATRRRTLQDAQAREEGRRRLIFQSEAQKQQVLASAFATAERVGGAFNFRDVEIAGPSGTAVTITAQEQEEAVIARKLAQFGELEDELAAKGGDPEKIAERIMKAKLAWFDGNGLSNPEWDQRLNSANMLASVSRILDNGEATAYLAETAETYRLLQTANPAYAAKIVKDEGAHEFFEAYADAVMDGAEKDEALLVASRLANRSMVEKAASRVNPAQAREAAERVLTGLSTGGGIFNLGADRLGLDTRYSAPNVAYVAERMERLTARGMTAERAAERVKEEVRKSAFVINGVLVPDRRGLPKDFPELALVALDDAFARYGEAEGIPDPEDLYLAEVDEGGRWIVLSKSQGGLPVGGPRALTLNQLEALRPRKEPRVPTSWELFGSAVGAVGDGIRAVAQPVQDHVVPLFFEPGPKTMEERRERRKAAIAEWERMDAERQQRIERLISSGGVSGLFGRWLERERDRELSDRGAYAREQAWEQDRERVTEALTKKLGRKPTLSEAWAEVMKGVPRGAK